MNKKPETLLYPSHPLLFCSASSRLCASALFFSLLSFLIPLGALSGLKFPVHTFRKLRKVLK